MTVKILTTGWPDQSSITLEELFDVCNDSIGYISLTDHSKEDETDQEPEYLNFIGRVRPYFISEFKTKTWYAFHLGNPSFPDKLTVRIYRFGPELYDFLRKVSRAVHRRYGREPYHITGALFRIFSGAGKLHPYFY